MKFVSYLEALDFHRKPQILYPSMENQGKKISPAKYRDSLSKLRQALVAMITHAPICSVRTVLWWKLTATTALQMGHFILMMPSTAVGSASNNLLFLQHGQATCTSCILFSPPLQRPAKRECQTDR